MSMDRIDGKHVIMQNHQKYNIELKDELPIKLLLFVVCPFLSFLYSLRRPKTRSSYIIFFLFGVIFAWHMDSRSSLIYDDFIEISDRFSRLSYSDEEIFSMLIDFFSFSENADKELFEKILTWITKKIYDNYHLYFALASIVYLTFMLGSLKFITKNEKLEAGFWGLLVIALFVIPRDIITVQNPRFTCGLWFNIYCTLHYYNSSQNKIKWGLLIVFSPFFHSGMWFYVFAFWICTLVSKYVKMSKLYIFTFYVSIPFSFLSFELLSSIDLNLLPIPQSMMKNIDFYMTDEMVQGRVLHKGGTGFAWIDTLFRSLMSISYSLIPYLLLKNKNNIESKAAIQFFNYFLLLSSLINFVQFVPVLGERYFWLFRILSIYFFLVIAYPRNKKYLLFVLFSCSWGIFRRYCYKGAVATCVPPEIWYDSLPMLILDGIK